MDYITVGLILRFTERVMILLAAVFTITKGVALLRENVGNPSNVEYKGLFGRFKITNAATGLVLALFGCFILGYVLYNKIEFSQPAAPAQKEDKKALKDLQAGIDKINQKGSVSKDDLKKLGEQVAAEIKKQEKSRKGASQGGQLDVKYESGSTGVYHGPKIQLSTIKSLFAIIKNLADHPNTINYEDLSSLRDIYTELYEFNKDNDQLKAYSPDKLK